MELKNSMNKATQNTFNFLKDKKKAKRKHSTRHINKNYYYTIKELTTLLKIHKRTISSWISKDLKTENTKANKYEY